MAGVGGVLAAGGFFGAYTIGKPKPIPTGTEVVALTTINPGQPLNGQVAVFNVPAAMIPTGAFTSISGLEGHSDTTQVFRGDPILETDVSQDAIQTRMGIPKGFEGDILGVSGESLAGTSVGDVVDIVSTEQSSLKGNPVLVPDAAIVGFFASNGAAMTTFSNAAGTASDVEIAVMPAQAELLAANGGGYSFVLDPWYVASKGAAPLGSVTPTAPKAPASRTSSTGRSTGTTEKPSTGTTGKSSTGSGTVKSPTGVVLGSPRNG